MLYVRLPLYIVVRIYRQSHQEICLVEIQSSITTYNRCLSSILLSHEHNRGPSNNNDSGGGGWKRTDAIKIDIFDNNYWMGCVIELKTQLWFDNLQWSVLFNKRRFSCSGNNNNNNEKVKIRLFAVDVTGWIDVKRKRHQKSIPSKKFSIIAFFPTVWVNL